MTVRTAVGTLEPRVVVLAEQDVDIRDLVQIVLEALDLEVVAVTDGPQALAACRQHRPGLLLLDVALRGLDGVEVCRQVRSDPELRDLPVLLMTSRATAESVAAGMAAGASAYLIKPFGPIELREVIGDLGNPDA